MTVNSPGEGKKTVSDLLNLSTSPTQTQAPSIPGSTNNTTLLVDVLGDLGGESSTDPGVTSVSNNVGGGGGGLMGDLRLFHNSDEDILNK